ncbi:MAG: IS21 family transposase [Myxococcales bacterium]|nr:IS21 family transposase [Myxococcales bacterium]
MNRRIEMYRLQDLVRLHRMKTSCREVAKLLGMSPNTERRYRDVIAEAGMLDGALDELPTLEELTRVVSAKIQERPVHWAPSSVARWQAAIEEMLEKGARPKAIYDKLRLNEAPFKGSLSAVKRMCKRLERAKGVSPEDVVIPVETQPGECAQVDFGYVGKLYDPVEGRLRKAWVFVLVLGYSRRMVARLVFDQRQETWLELHIEAFHELGGVPAVLVPDNLKAAVVRAAFCIDDEVWLNRSYRELARHYGFIVDPTPVNQPKKKGKVESAVKYIKRNFFKPRGPMDIDEARRELQRWVCEIANERIHGTTRRKPRVVFEDEEQRALRPLPPTRYELAVWKKATVHPDCHVNFANRLYSVPWQLVGQQVWLRATATTLVAYANNERVATHSRREPGVRTTDERHLPEQRAAWRHRSRGYWEQRAAQLGPDVAAYIQEVFEADDALSQLRAVQSIVSHLEGFPPERAAAACRRARYYANYSYQGIKNILKKALDLEPLPNERQPALGMLTNPRFARSIDELLAIHRRENHDAPN